MRTSGEFISSKWLRIFQVVVGLVCVGISISIMVNFAYRETSHIGAYSLIFLASIAFIIIGIERIAVGIKLTSLKRSSRLISIGIGVGIVVFFGSGYFFPEFVSKLYVLILGLGLLATGALKTIDGMRNKTYKKTTQAIHARHGHPMCCCSISGVYVPYLRLCFLVVDCFSYLFYHSHSNRICRGNRKKVS